MKNLLIIILVLFILISIIGCNSEESSKESSLSIEQKKAVDNSIKFISNSSFTSKNRINTKIIKIETVTESTLESVWIIDPQIEKQKIDSSDWVITIGDTSGHNFAVVVCDSDTCEVIGYIPIH